MVGTTVNCVIYVSGTSWHLAADSTGDETQLSATQGKRFYYYNVFFERTIQAYFLYFFKGGSVFRSEVMCSDCGGNVSELC